MSDLRGLLSKKGLYYSDNCFRDNLQILGMRPIPKSDYDNIKEEDLPHYEIRTIKNTATLKCSHLEFSFCTGEYFSVVNDLIQKSLKGAPILTIYDNEHNKIVSPTDKITDTSTYDLKIKYQFQFKNLNGEVSYHTMNYFSTVEDAKYEIILSIQNSLATPDDITIYNKNKKKIYDPNKKIISFPNYEEAIFYSIEYFMRMSKNIYRNSNAITNYLVKKRLFYSDKCLKCRLHLYVSGKEVTECMFSYKDVKESEIEIKDGENIVTIEYNGMKFILCNDERLSVAVGLIQRTFKICEDVSIYDSNNKKLPITLMINEKTKYIVEVKFKFKFKTIEKKENTLNMDCLSTVNDAKLKLSSIYSHGNLEKIVIYDNNKTEIHNPNLKLINIQNYQKQIYFEINNSRREQPLNRTQKHKSDFSPNEVATPTPEIHNIHEPEVREPVSESTQPSKRRIKIKMPTVSPIKDKSEQSPVKKVPIIKQSSSDDEVGPITHKDNDEGKLESNNELLINFVFSEDLEKKYSIFKKKFNTETTVKEICDMIKEKCKIEDQIIISYKYKNLFCEVDDQTLNIGDIRDDIVEKEKNGKSQNVLYIDIKKQEKRSKSDPVEKKDKRPAKKEEPIRKSRDKSSSDDGSTSHSKKRKRVKKKKVARKTSHDADDKNPSSKRSRNASAILKNSSSSSEDDKSSPRKQETDAGISVRKKPHQEQPSSSSEDEKLNHQRLTRNTKDLCSSEAKQLKKENDELSSQLKDFQLLFSFYNKSLNEENFFIDQKEEERYHKIVSKIGEGATSITYKVIDTKNESFICKKVLKDDHYAFKNAQNMMKEFEILHKLKHPCICQAYWINTSEIVKDANIEIKEEMTEKTTVSIFLEYLEHKLNDLLKNNINNTLKVRIIVEIAHAMNFIHKQGLIHRDLKIDNIMLNSVYEAKVVDFGLARIHELFDSKYSFLNESMSKGVGTLAYMSPEMLNESDYDYKTDVYSFGIVLYFIFLGNLPKQSMKDKTNGKLIDLPSSSSSISNFCIDLIKRCLSFDPSKRPSFEDILTDIRRNEYLLASYIDQSAIYIRDHELELFNKYNK